MVNLSYLFRPSLAISKGIEAQSTGHNLMQVKKVSLRSHIVFWSMCRVMVQTIGAVVQALLFHLHCQLEADSHESYWNRIW